MVGELDRQRFRSSKLSVAVGIVLAVVGLAALGVLPIMASALRGVVVMILTGVIKPVEAYEAVQWDVIFPLAGVIPLGKALSETGGPTFSVSSSSRAPICFPRFWCWASFPC